jgi:hypothetical protein
MTGIFTITDTGVWTELEGETFCFRSIAEMLEYIQRFHAK